MDYLTHVGVLAGLAVLVLEQILKLKAVPVKVANKYPVPTLIVLSVLASAFVVWQDMVVANSWTDWVLLVSTVGVVAAVVYNHTIKNWSELREMEG